MNKFVLNSKETINDSIKHSDVALYEAKKIKGRSQFLKYSDLTAADGIQIFDDAVEFFKIHFLISLIIFKITY